MLMGCPIAEQNALYADYWLPMERVLGSLSFDAFLHDWMVVTLKRPVSKNRYMYSEFKRFAADSSLPRMERTRGLLENMLEYTGYYAAIKGIASAGSGDANVDRHLASIDQHMNRVGADVKHAQSSDARTQIHHSISLYHRRGRSMSAVFHPRPAAVIGESSQ